MPQSGVLKRMGRATKEGGMRRDDRRPSELAEQSLLSVFHHTDNRPDQQGF